MQDTFHLRFARHGMFLLLAGLLTGLVIGKFHSHHLGNAAHVTGLIGGFGLIAVASLWPRLRLGPRWSRIGAWSFILSIEFSWLGLFVTAALGRAPDTPATLVAPSAASWNLIGGGILAAGVILSIVGTLIALMGLRPSSSGSGATVSA